MLGSHFWFVREGDAFLLPGAGVCGPAAKPGFAEGAIDASWINMGAIESLEPNATQEDYKLWKPAPGRLVLKDVLENKQELSWKITVNDVKEIHMELMYRTSQKLGGAQKQFNPLSAPSRRGWAHIEQYDQDNNLVATLEFWCRLRGSFKADGTPSKPEMELYMLYNDLNAGAIA